LAYVDYVSRGLGEDWGGFEGVELMLIDSKGDAVMWSGACSSIVLVSWFICSHVSVLLYTSKPSSSSLSSYYQGSMT
jgi:hypothetical protein